MSQYEAASGDKNHFFVNNPDVNQEEASINRRVLNCWLLLQKNKKANLDIEVDNLLCSILEQKLVGYYLLYARYTEVKKE
jgi:hypothetical protein